jgi:hypothetical protein
MDRQLAGPDLRGDALERRADREPHVERVEHARVDVGGAADGRRVAEVDGDLFDRSLDGALARGLRARGLARDRQRDGRERGGVPGAEVLRGVVAAGRLLEVLVDVLRAR